MRLRRWLTLGLGLLLAWSSPVRAQAPLNANLDEQQALLSMEQKKLIRLREQARVLMEKHPDAPSSYYFMGYSLHHSEGDLPRARFYLKKAIRVYQKLYGTTPNSSQPWGWLDRSQLELEQVAGEMDQYQEQISVLDDCGKLYREMFGREVPYLQALYAWPLMKINKEQEARQRLAIASQYIDEPTRTTYLNTLGAVEMESDHPAEAYKAFMTLLADVKSHHWSLNCTYLRNGGEAAASVGKTEEAEQLYLEATNYFDPVSFSNPWWDLSTLYLTQARFPEAISCLRKAQRWIYDSEPFLAQQSFAATQQLACELLLQCGLTEPALKIAKEFVDRPDRKGGDSVRPDQWESANLLVYREAILSQRAADAEEMSWAKGFRWWKLLFEQERLGYDAYLAGQRAAAILIEHDRLYSSLRYAYAPGTVVVPNYIRVDLAGIYGAGTTVAAVDELMGRKFEGLERERPFLETLQAEALALAGDTTQADAMITRLFTTLPGTEVLLRMRMTARLAELKESEGDFSGALSAYQRVLERAPAMLRLLNLQIPVEVAGDQGDVLSEAASMTMTSPRFKRHSGGFTIQFQTGGKGYEALLMTPNSTVLARAEVTAGNTTDETARKLVAELHKTFFAANVDLSQLDVNSLDGVVTGTVRSKQLQDMFFPGLHSDDTNTTTNTTP